MRVVGWALVCSLSLCVAGYAAVGYLSQPVGALVHPEIRAALEARPAVVLAHVLASAAALVIGSLQFLARVRRAAPRVHAWLGRSYVAGVLLGALAGLQMAAHAYGGSAARLGFASLALVWLYASGRGWLAIRAGDVAAHERWMIRSFALAFAAVTLRLYVAAAMASGIAFEAAYPAIAWLCWVPNVLVAQRLIAARTPKAAARAPAWPAPAPRRAARGAGERGSDNGEAQDRADPCVRGTS